MAQDTPTTAQTIPIPTTEPELPSVPLDESALNPEYDPAKDQRAPFLKTPTNTTGPTISPAPAPGVLERAKKVVTEGIPRYSTRTPANPKYGQEQFLAPEEALTPEEQRQHPVATGALEAAGGLTSPATISTVAATAGLGEVGVIPKVLSGLFTGQIAASVYDQYPALKDAVNRAQTAKTKEEHDDAFADAQRLLTHMGADTVMGLLAAKHGAEGAKEILDTTTGSGVPDQASTFKNPSVEPALKPEETHPEMNRDTVKQLQNLGYSNQHITNFNIGEIRDILKNQTPAAEHPVSQPAAPAPDPEAFAEVGGKLVSKPAVEKPVEPVEKGAPTADPIEDLIMSDKIGGKKVRGATPKPELAPLPPQPKLPDTGTYPAIKTDDGGIYVDIHPAGRTHIMFAQEQGIPPERIVSGGWLKDGDYDASERSDAGRWGEQARAKLAVAAKRTPEPEAFAEHGGKFVGKSPEAPAPAAPEQHPTVAALKEKFGSTSDPSAMTRGGASFLHADGTVTNIGATDHPMAIAQATGTKPSAIDRTDFINDTGSIRVRHRPSAKAGPEIVFSVPEQGVTPEQVDMMKQAVGKMGRNGNLLIESTRAGEEPSESVRSWPENDVKEFARPSDVEPMLQKIGAHPDQQDLISKELQTPHKETYRMEVTSLDGMSHKVDVDAHSPKQALAAVQKQFPAAAEWRLDTMPEAKAPSTEYSVPTGKIQKMKESMGRPELHTIRHELGHVFNAARNGLQQKGMISSSHPGATSDTRAGVLVSSEGLYAGGKLKSDKLPAVVKYTMAGIAADEVFNDLPRSANHNFRLSAGGDGAQAYRYLKAEGMTHEEALDFMHKAIDENVEYLKHPVVSAMMHENAGVREAGLSRQYHFSPERLDSIIAETNRRMANEKGTGKPDNGAANAGGNQNRPAAHAGGEGAGTQGAVGEPQEKGIVSEEKQQSEDETPFHKLTPQQQIEKMGLIYKGEERPQVHVFEHPDYPGLQEKLYEPYLSESTLRENIEKIKQRGEPSPHLKKEDFSTADYNKLLPFYHGFVNDKRYGNGIFTKGTLSPKEIGSGFLLSNGDIYQQVDEFHSMPERSEFPKNTIELASGGEGDAFRVSHRPSEDQLQEMARLFKESGNDKVYWDFTEKPEGLEAWETPKVTESGEGSLGDFRRAIDKKFPEDIISEEKIKKEMTPELAQQIVDAHEAAGGSTFNLTHGNLAGTDNYAVSINPERGETLDHPPTAKEIQDFAAKNADLLKNPDKSLGTWHNTANDTHTLDVVSTLQNRKKAVALGKKNNQIAIYHLGGEGEIPTGGTGVTPFEPSTGGTPEAPAAPPMPEASESLPLVSTRMPSKTVKGKTIEEHTNGALTSDMQAATAAPGYLEKLADRVANTPGFKDPGGDATTRTNAYIRHVADNIKFVWSKLTPEAIKNDEQWYPVGAHERGIEVAKQHAIDPHQAYAVTAALSPLTDWDQNTSQAERAVNIWKNQQGTKFTPEMKQAGKDIASIPAMKKFATKFKKLEGKTLGELADVRDQALWLRLYDEGHNSREYQTWNPDGMPAGIAKNQDGSPKAMGWSFQNLIEHAIQILQDGSQENISKVLGTGHKVRNFYNNQLAPDDPRFLTIDTHAVNIGQLRPMSGKTPAVKDNFGGISNKPYGLKGTYALHDAGYRLAAKELDIPIPSRLQSPTWVKIREVFPNQFKTPENQQAIDAIWKEHTDGKITIDDARNKIWDYAEGWNSRNAGGVGDTSDQGELFNVGVHGESAGGAAGRGTGSDVAPADTAVDEGDTSFDFGANKKSAHEENTAKVAEIMAKRAAMTEGLKKGLSKK